MKKLAIKMINAYQVLTKNTSNTCRYQPSCSQYGKEAYETRNFFVASALTAWRILRCNPFSKGGYDPVPRPKNQKGTHTHERLSEHTTPGE